MYQLPPEYKSSVCEIKTMQNELLSTGVITSITSEYLEISERTGSMPILRFRDEVKLSIFNHKYGFRVLSGLVYISNRKFLRVFDTSNILDYERRNFFRVDTDINAEVMLFRESADNEPLPREKIRIRNLSLGGAMIQTITELESGEVFQLHLPINNKSCVFTCRVHRSYPKDNNYWVCGCEFLEYSESQSDILCAYLFQCQRMYLEKL